MRVNARFEGVAEQQVAYLAATLDASVSEVLRLSVNNLYTSMHGEKPRKLKYLGKYIGKGGKSDSRPSDLSVNYKAELSKILADKYKRQP